VQFRFRQGAQQLPADLHTLFQGSRTALLHQFPFEANIAARFTVLDETSTTQLLDRLTLQVLLEASAKPDSALGQALATAIVVAADQTFKDVVSDAIKKRNAIEAWTQRAGSVDKAMAELSKMLGLDPNDTQQSIEQEYFSNSLIPAAEWPALMEILADGLKTDGNAIDALTAARLMLIGGATMDGERHIWWNFVASSRESIEEAKTRWREKRFAVVPGETEFIPLPDDH